MADEDERPRKRGRRAPTLRYTSTPDWDPSSLEGELRAGGGEEDPFRDGDGPDDGDVGDREPRRPLRPVDSGAINLPLPVDD